MSINAIIEKHAGIDANNNPIWLMDSTYNDAPEGVPSAGVVAIRLATAIGRPVRVTWVDETGGQRVFRPGKAQA
jgi:hypothetical protein